MDENKVVNNEENEAPIPKTNRFLFGAGCILIAAGVAIIALFGGEEADESGVQAEALDRGGRPFMVQPLQKTSREIREDHGVIRSSASDGRHRDYL